MFGPYLLVMVCRVYFSWLVRVAGFVFVWLGGLLGICWGLGCCCVFFRCIWFGCGIFGCFVVHYARHNIGIKLAYEGASPLVIAEILDETPNRAIAYTKHAAGLSNPWTQQTE